jgi:hypothetical protein
MEPIGRRALGNLSLSPRNIRQFSALTTTKVAGTTPYRIYATTPRVRVEFDARPGGDPSNRSFPVFGLCSRESSRKIFGS